MIRTKIAVALCCLTLVSSANAGFSFSSTEQGTVDGYKVFLIRAINDGVGTGTELDGYDLTFSVWGARAHFNVIDGTADLINTSNPNRGFIRVGAAATTSIVYASPPITEGAQWESIQTWNVAAISTGSQNATGSGAVIARLFLDDAALGQVTGSIGGNLGEAQVVNSGIFLGTIVDPDMEAPILTINPSSVTINVTNQTSFGPVEVSATDLESGIDYLVPGTIHPQIADNITITGPTTGPLTINGSGFNEADIGTYTIDFTAADLSPLSNTSLRTFTLTVTDIPEPAPLSLLAGLSLLGLRRRKQVFRRPCSLSRARQ